MTACALANPCWVEVSALQHHVLGGLVGTRTLATEDAGDTHRLLGVADAQVVLAQGVLLTIEGNKLGALRLGANHNLMSCHHVGVEAVQRLSVCHHDVVGDIHDVVDWAQADDVELVLQPLRAFLHLAVGDAHASVALASLVVLNLHLDRQVFVIHLEFIARWAMKGGLVTILLQPSVEVASHAIVAECVGTVGGDVYLDEPVALQVVVFSGRLTYGSVLWQDDDASVVGADADFILGANHTEALHAAKLALLDGETLVAVVEHAAQVGYDDLLACGHVRRAADYLLWLALAQVNGGYMEVIAVRMHLACQNLTYVETFQSTLDRLYFFQSIDFETAGGQRIGCLLWREVEIDVFFKPFI